jgi:hypothetical protein
MKIFGTPNGVGGLYAPQLIIGSANDVVIMAEQSR